MVGDEALHDDRPVLVGIQKPPEQRPDLLAARVQQAVVRAAALLEGERARVEHAAPRHVDHSGVECARVDGNDGLYSLAHSATPPW